MIRLLPRSTPFPYTTLFRSIARALHLPLARRIARLRVFARDRTGCARAAVAGRRSGREVEHEHSGEDRECSEDRKSTRLNSSHMSISYAVFCLKKKNIINIL